MGLLREGINEIIATTAYNAAPMGIHLRNNNITMVLFTGSHTAQNIERDGWVIANVVHDPVLFVRTAFEDLPRESFIDEPVNGRIMQRLLNPDAWAAFTATVENKTNEAMMVRLTLIKEIIEGVSVHPVNRGFNSIIDATVHATRYKENQDPKLQHLIAYHTAIVKKCGGKQEMEALDLLLKYIF
jgi:uncharacterized protein